MNDNTEVLQLKKELQLSKESEKNALQSLRRFTEMASDNDRVSQGLNAVELAIFRAVDFKELFEQFVFEIQKQFKIPIVRIVLTFDETPFRKLTIESVTFEFVYRHCYMAIKEDIKSFLEDEKLFSTSNVDPKTHHILLPEEELEKIKSFVIIPIYSSSVMVGAIGFGAEEKERFDKKKSFSLVQELAKKFSICLDNLLRSEELRVAHVKLEELSITDNLTEILNRRGIERIFDRKLAEMKRKIFNSMTVAFIDLNKFKPINDRFGHLAGDQALVFFTRNLMTAARSIDGVGRVGGDEFVLIFPDANKEGVDKFFERLEAQIKKKPFEYEGQIIKIGFSYGVREVLEKDVELTFAEIIKKADKEMYKHKQNSR